MTSIHFLAISATVTPARLEGLEVKGVEVASGSRWFGWISDCGKVLVCLKMQSHCHHIRLRSATVFLNCPCIVIIRSSRGVSFMGRLTEI